MSSEVSRFDTIETTTVFNQTYQKSGSPSPLRDDDRGSKTGLDRASSSVEVLGSDVSNTSVLLADHDDDGGDDTEKSTKTNNDGPADSLWEWRSSSKERVLSLVLQEWRGRFREDDGHGKVLVL